MATRMKEIILNHMQVRNSWRTVDQREAETATFDANCAKVKGDRLEWTAGGRKQKEDEGTYEECLD